MTKPKGYSGHSDCTKRKLTARQRATLRKRGQVTIKVVGFPKIVRRANVRNGAIEWYRRSDRHGEPAIRDYARDSKMTARNRPSKPKGRMYEGDRGRRT